MHILVQFKATIGIYSYALYLHCFIAWPVSSSLEFKLYLKEKEKE